LASILQILSLKDFGYEDNFLKIHEESQLMGGALFWRKKTVKKSSLKEKFKEKLKRRNRKLLKITEKI
jgi:hypothetical protein